MRTSNKKVKTGNSTFYDIYVGELIEVITKLRTVRTMQNPETGDVESIDMPMVIEGILLEECDNYYHFGTMDGITNSLAKEQVVHVSIISDQELVKMDLLKLNVDNKNLN